MMDASVTFHYPPDLMSLMIDTVPLLCRSKRDVLLFFQGAGVPARLTQGLAHRVHTDRTNISKYEIARTVLAQINEGGDASAFLRMRREILRRVVEFEDFSACWEKDRLPAQGLVGQVRKLVDASDSFTRMRKERDAERRKHTEAKEAENLKQKERVEELASIKDRLYALFQESDTQKRGKALEGVLNNLFAWAGILVCDEFTVRMENGKPLEQVDGVVEMDGTLYLVEMKWWKDPLGVPEIQQHISRVFLRGGQVRGIVISYSGFAESAIETCKEAYATGATITLCELNELIPLMESGGDFRAFFKAKINASLLRKQPLSAVAF